ncbi:hypothetical protein LCGC14_0932510 [marine sediment metagenome]|uniref:Uncharacterized protein n=1 Tax=marine sediment metagenome TaxID=412755 RepID=A0A0F9R604_9ZZZZ
MYGSVANVVTMTGLRPSDLKFETTEELNAWLAGRLTEIAILIDKDRNRSDWDEQGWLPAIDMIADRWCAEFVRFIMATRDAPIVKVDDLTVEVPSDSVPGKGVLRDLRRFPRTIDKQFVLEMGVVRAPPETAT